VGEDKKTGAAATLNLSGLLTIPKINEAKDALLGSFADNRAVRLSIDPESDIDVSGIQLIFAAKSYAESRSISLSLSAPISGRGLSVMERGGFLAALSVEDRRFWLLEGR
jgi:hypothetical protein